MVPPEEVKRGHIAGYAAVVNALAHLSMGEVEAAEAALARARALPYVEANVYLDAAEAMMASYDETGDLVTACSAMEGVVAERPDDATFFGWYGYGTERMTVDELCPLDEPAEGGSPQV
jgi:hypothetical protein